jgi:putative ABC transport system permease protein
MVLSGAWQDFLDELIGRQFWRRERVDAALFLVHPRPESVLARFSRIPGVHSAQGQRVAPALVRFRQSEREVALVGVPAPTAVQKGTRLRHRDWVAPSTGVDLPSPLARVLGAAVGDEIEITLLEGKGTRWQERVAGISNEPVGTLIPLAASKLSQALDEPDLVNLVTLEADSTRWKEIEARLDEYPEVAGAGLKRDRLASFNRTVGRIVKISTLVLGIFSLLIATGVVFNLVRVSFSERSWEMASLRVLGLSDGSVFSILGAETAVQVGLALIPGAIAGWFWIYWSSRWIHSEAMEFPVIVDPSTYGMAGGVAILALALSLLSCWRKLLRLSPVSALKARE